MGVTRDSPSCVQDSVERLSRHGSAHGTPVRRQPGKYCPAQRPVNRHLEVAEAAWQLHSGTGTSAPAETCPEPASESEAATPAASAGTPEFNTHALERSPAAASAAGVEDELAEECALAVNTGRGIDQAAGCTSDHSQSHEQGGSLSGVEESGGHCPHCARLQADMEQLQEQVTRPGYTL